MVQASIQICTSNRDNRLIIKLMIMEIKIMTKTKIIIKDMTIITIMINRIKATSQEIQLDKKFQRVNLMFNHKLRETHQNQLELSSRMLKRKKSLMMIKKIDQDSKIEQEQWLALHFQTNLLVKMNLISHLKQLKINKLQVEGKH